MSIAASNCAVQWQFDSYPTVTGSWAPLSYGVDAKGNPLILVGTSDLDSAEYAINARNGKEVWRFQGPTPGDYDMAAGATISSPEPTASRTVSPTSPASTGPSTPSI